MTRRLRALLVTALLACALVACASVLGFERLSPDSDEGGAPANEGGTDGPAKDSGADAPAPRCDDIGVGSPPTDAGASDGDLDPVHVAVKIFDFGIDSSRGATGFNLDKTCTVDRMTASCTTNVDNTTFDTYSKDLGNGVDNASYNLLAYLAVVSSTFSPKAVNERLQSGEFGLVARVSAWNGAANDTDVIVELFPAVGVWKSTGGTLSDGGTPSFTSKDLWMRDTRFQLVGGADASKITSVDAWVANGKLVAFFKDVTIPISVPTGDPKPLDLVFHEVWLTGDLTVVNGKASITGGVMAGRWKTSEFLGQIRTIYIKDAINLKNVVLCDNTTSKQVYDAVKKAICDGRDIRGASTEDNTGKPCDALSAGLRFEAYGVDDPGDFVTAPKIPARCTGTPAVPLGDDCPP